MFAKCQAAFFFAAITVANSTNLFAADSDTIKGRVTDVEGKAISARVRIVYPQTARGLLGRFFGSKTVLKTVSNTKGEFSLTPRRGSEGMVLVEADGFAPTWQSTTAAQNDENLTLRLVENAEIKGRIVDANGKPIAGAEVKFQGAYRFPDGKP